MSIDWFKLFHSDTQGKHPFPIKKHSKTSHWKVFLWIDIDSSSKLTILLQMSNICWFNRLHTPIPSNTLTIQYFLCPTKLSIVTLEFHPYPNYFSTLKCSVSKEPLVNHQDVYLYIIVWSFIKHDQNLDIGPAVYWTSIPHRPTFVSEDQPPIPCSNY